MLIRGHPEFLLGVPAFLPSRPAATEEQNSMEKSIAVIDPSRLARAGLVILLRTSGYDRIHEADNMAALIAAGGDCHDIEIIIVRLSNGNHVPKEIMEQARKVVSDVRVLFLAPYLDVRLLSECFSAGASGYLSESACQEMFIGGLRLIGVGGKVFPPELADLIPQFAAVCYRKTPESSECYDNTLSERERDILRELAIGQTNKMIAARLHIAEGTVKVYVKRILRKTGAHNRTQAALWATTHGFVEI